ncbi:MAG: hypothetical protein CVT66_11285 [Actinobacteria bacterium HGW-Actinobacteria-6]|nr:MAG: hypothetical protein CVT66_11285 [Actinobacteria bacterium HGW-Actinobacteria-6]
MPAETTETEVMPVVTDTPPAGTPAPESGEVSSSYEEQYARYQQEYAAWQAGQANSQAEVPQYPAAHPASAASAAVPPKKKSKTGLIVGLVLGGLLIIGLAIAALAVLGVLSFAPTQSSESQITEESPVEVLEPAGFASAQEALDATLADYGSDWVSKVYEETDTSVTYWVGPPSSEYESAITVSRAADGTWSVTAQEPLDFAGDVIGEMSSPEEQAMDVVDAHLMAVKENRGMDAHELTVDPFASDSASAGEANGEFTGFTIEEAKQQSDGSFWVKTTQVWTWGSEKWQYWVVPTEAGYRIADMKEW